MTDPHPPEGVETPAPHEEPWTARPHDHLVEPVFGGLGVGESDTRAVPEDVPPGPPREAGRTILAWSLIGGAVTLGAFWVLFG